MYFIYKIYVYRETQDDIGGNSINDVYSIIKLIGCSLSKLITHFT